MNTGRRRVLLFTYFIPRRASRALIHVATLALFVYLFACGPVATASAAITFTAEELLGKPTDTSVTVNIVPASTIEYWYEYGTASGVYTGQTDIATATGGQPSEVTISGLSANTRYYYRMVYDGVVDGVLDDSPVTRTEHSFWTQRAADEPFVFAVTADIHNNLNTKYQNAMTNILDDQPDFAIDLGDTFLTGDSGGKDAARTRYLNHRGASYLGKIGSSVPILLVTGNHEDEEGWNLDDTGAYATGLWNIELRKAYFPTPTDGTFYSGNTDPLASAIGGDTNREDYYAWTWGDALFVVIDEFQYTMDLSYTPAAGELSDDPVTGDQWSWTLGQQQHDWLRETLEDSTAKYKFVFSHNMLGGIPRPIVGVGAGYVRGGAEAADYFEWGGQNANGTDGFASHRPGWDKTIEQLFVENRVSAYFHGHDHQYVYETRDDGVVYQEVPSPTMSGSGFSGIYSEGDHGHYNTVKMLGNSGHLRVTVGPDHATVDYISSNSTAGTNNYSYTILPRPPVDIAGATIDPIPAQTYNGSPFTPEPVVSMGTTVLVKDTDYTVAYAANTDAGTATVTVSGIGNYTGTKDAHFTILPATPTVNTWPTASPIMSGQALSASVLSGGDASVAGTLVEGSFAFTTPTAVPLVSGPQSVTFTPDNANYAAVVGSVPVQVNAPRKATDLSAATIAPIADKAYTGKAIEPAPAVTLAGATLAAGTDYSVAYANNVKAGKATLTVTGAGAYSGSQPASFVIVPKKARIAKLTPGVKRFTARWAKHPGAGGYQLAYSTKKASGFKTRATTKAAKTVKNLNSTKRYYVKLRAFVTIDGTRHYGAWSTVKKVKVK